MKPIQIILFIFFSITIAQAQQAQLYVEVQDTVAIGKPFKVSFTLENANGQIETPEFIGLEVVGGPNYGSSIQIINGDKNQTISLTYYLVAQEPGEWVIERASVEVEGTFIESEPVVIVANEEGGRVKPDTRQNWMQEFSFPSRRQRTPVIPDKPSMTKKDSILQKYKSKKF